METGQATHPLTASLSSLAGDNFAPYFLHPTNRNVGMPQFLIERQIPGAGKLSSDELKAISQKSCGVISGMNRDGKDVQWVQSYVTGDKIYCVYNAPNEKAVKEHATKGGFPANSIMKVARMISPITAETG
jgi:Protein of unknown function (DUF4242)